MNESIAWAILAGTLAFLWHCPILKPNFGWRRRPTYRELREDRDATREALANIIYASDGCHGHRGCNHSMEPWREARRLLWPDAGDDE